MFPSIPALRKKHHILSPFFHFSICLPEGKLLKGKSPQHNFPLFITKKTYFMNTL
ncbi:hypothetical protein B14911_15820 [Bacillus sp. NRRL B-14911]|nr:hypothetical protein B14911_15820 [Bacillus sp. NRRL B-14911]